jgi:hypothetical protein
MPAQTHATGVYRGLRVRVLWAGWTRFGKRARVQYGDRPAVWVNADEVRLLSGKPCGNGCRECGGRIVGADDCPAYGGRCGACCRAADGAF